MLLAGFVEAHPVDVAGLVDAEGRAQVDGAGVARVDTAAAGVELPNTVHGQAGPLASGVAGNDSCENPMASRSLLAVTVKVYVVPFVRLLMVAEVAVPGTVVGACAAAPTYGVIV